MPRTPSPIACVTGATHHESRRSLLPNGTPAPSPRVLESFSELQIVEVDAIHFSLGQVGGSRSARAERGQGYVPRGVRRSSRKLARSRRWEKSGVAYDRLA